MWLSPFPLGPAPSLAGWLAREFHRGGTTGGAVALIDDGQFIRTRLKLNKSYTQRRRVSSPPNGLFFFKGFFLRAATDQVRKEGGREKKRKVRTSGGRESEWWSWIETRADKNRKQSSWVESRPRRLWREATSRRTWLSVWFAVSSAQVKPLTVFRARELRRFPRSSALLVDGEVCGRMCVAWEED